MEHRIEFLDKTFLVGKKRTMSFSSNATLQLWQSFMPVRNAVKNRINNYYYSVEVYDDPGFFTAFDPSATFEKWAAVETNGSGDLPDEMESLIIPSGTYAVFQFKGPGSNAPLFYKQIFTE
jgi:AraC family transcriptional regulator